MMAVVLLSLEAPNAVMEDTAPAQTSGLKIQHPYASRSLASSLQVAVHPHMWQPRLEKEKLLRMQDLQTSSLNKSYKIKYKEISEK